MYLHRGSRPDIAQAVARMSRFMTNWTVHNDAQLHRLMQYLVGALNLSLIAIIDERDQGELMHEMYVDSDHAGDPVDTKSTGGSFQVLTGSYGSCIPIEWCSKKQKATAHNSAEAELVALAEHSKYCLKTHLVSEAMST